jgi:S-DNA-T family DNA segregation ATPase FtsK/SpoIIIE
MKKQKRKTTAKKVVKTQKSKKPIVSKKKTSSLSEETKRQLKGILLLVSTIIVTLGFFDVAGIGGHALRVALFFLIGRAMYLVPLVLLAAGITLTMKKEERTGGFLWLASLLFLIGFAGIFESMSEEVGMVSVLGYAFLLPISKLFGPVIPYFVFTAAIITGMFLFYKVLKKHFHEDISGAIDKVKSLDVREEKKVEKKPSLVNKVFNKKEAPEFSIKSLDKEPSFIVKKKADKKEKKAEDKKEVAPKINHDFGALIPPFSLLKQDQGKAEGEDTDRNAAVIKKTLSDFDINVEMSGVTIGPTVTQFALKPADGVKLSKITSLANDLALSLAAQTVRIEAPIPGKSLVGIEIPNKTRAMVGLRSLFEAPGFRAGLDKVNIALGKDVSGDVIFGNIPKMPHMLVAGSTGSGKTIFLNSLILSMVYQHTPETLKMVLVDPKRVEFAIYGDLPHLLSPILHTPGKTVKCLEWMITEMERRFETMAGLGVRDITSYNKKSKEVMPYIVFVIDELADLMMARGKELEAAIVRLAQMARAVGIHLVLATQRPSVEVITGLIKANIPARISFLVASQIDSRTVLDQAGAEKLLGAGDMLYLAPNANKPSRLQAAYVSETEVKQVMDYIRENYHEDVESENALSEELMEKLDETEAPLPTDNIHGNGAEEDALFEEAKDTVIQYNKASASMLQRYLRVGYSRAARLIDMLEERGIVGPQEGSKPREVFGEVKEDEELTGEIEGDDSEETKEEYAGARESEEASIVIDPEED